MSQESSSASHRSISQQTTEKFQFYLLSLVFTLLALSIQTAKFGSSQVEDILELLGWFAFAISGLSGLSYLEWLPLIHSQFAKKSDAATEVVELKKLKLTGQDSLHVLSTDATQTIDERLGIKANGIALLERQIQSLERKSLRKYKVFTYFFALGVVCILSARAYSPASKLIYSFQ